MQIKVWKIVQKLNSGKKMAQWQKIMAAMYMYMYMCMIIEAEFEGLKEI